MSFDRLTLTWQPVEAEEEEEERSREQHAQTEAQQQVLEVIKQLRSATATMVNNELGGRYGTVWKQLNALWARGHLEAVMIG